MTGLRTTPSTSTTITDELAAAGGDESGVAELPLAGDDAPEIDPVPAAARRAGPATRRPASRAGPAPAGHIEIPAIGLSHPTYEGIDLPTIDRGPSHWPGTARPGHVGNTVFPGHRTTHSRPFYAMDRLVPGDEVTFTTAEGRFTYAVTELFVVDANAMWIADPTEDATFTIFACHPKGSARQRIVAKGRLVSAPAAPPTTTTTAPTTTTTAPPERRPVLAPFLGGGDRS